MAKKSEFKSGYIAVIGKPNVGKSTIINYFLANKLNIVTSRPQTTRNNILGILTTNSYQMIFIDTPGIHNPQTLLGKNMLKAAKASISDSDIIIFVLDPFDITTEDKLVARTLKNYTNTVFLVINKIDLVKSKDNLLPVISEAQNLHDFQDLIPISAGKGKNMSILKNKLENTLSAGPKYYPEDQLSDKQERFFASEIIREQALKTLWEEVPHSIAVKIEEMKDRSDKLSYIKALIYVERKSQKKIIIGKNGQQLKKIGTRSRKQLEKFLNRKIYLDLWVKTIKHWQQNPSFLKQLGYK